jgi:hypothetical protein
MVTTSTARVHRFRARSQRGRIVLAVEVDEVTLAAALIESRLLDPNEADDREALTQATETLLKIFAKEQSHSKLAARSPM